MNSVLSLVTVFMRVVVMAALCNRAGHYIFALWFLLFSFFPRLHLSQKVAKNRHLGTIAQLRRVISSQLRHVSTIGKNLLSSNMSSRCLHNMANFGPLSAEIGLLVWDTPANFNGFCV